MNDESQADELENRLFDFAVRVITLTDSLPKTRAANHIARQLVRCGTSAAPNYAEARGAESLADFIHKLKVVLKELNECGVWLRMICRAQFIDTGRLSDLIEENRQLARIVNASVSTAKSRRQDN